MSLIIYKNIIKQIANEDIHCFKVLKFNHNKYTSPYYPIEYKFGEMIEAKIKGFTKYDNYRTKNPTWWQCINSGLHSFAAINELSYFEDKNDLVICSAVIPKGAEYYEGFTEMYSTSSYEDDVTTRKAFVSNKLIVVDKYMNENT